MGLRGRQLSISVTSAQNATSGVSISFATPARIHRNDPTDAIFAMGLFNVLMFSNAMFELAMVEARGRVLGVEPVTGVSARRRHAVRISLVTGAPGKVSRASTLQPLS